MNRGAFFEAAGLLWNSVASLFRFTETSLCEVEDLLCVRRDVLPGAPPGRAVVVLTMREIKDRIEEVITTYDLLCDAAGLPPHLDQPG